MKCTTQFFDYAQLLNFTVQLAKQVPADNISSIEDYELQLVLNLLRARAQGNMVYQTFVTTYILYPNGTQTIYKREYPAN